MNPFIYWDGKRHLWIKIHKVGKEFQQAFLENSGYWHYSMEYLNLAQVNRIRKQYMIYEYNPSPNQVTE